MDPISYPFSPPDSPLLGPTPDMDDMMFDDFQLNGPAENDHASIHGFQDAILPKNVG